MKQKLKNVLNIFDHADLNSLDYFSKINPSSENIAQYIYDELKKDEILRGNVAIARVSVWETDRSCASYYE